MRHLSHKTTIMTHFVLGHKIIPQPVTGDFDLVVGETPSGTPGPPPHYHNTYHEVFLVIEGEMEFMVNGKSMVLKNGDSVNLPPSSVHTFANNSNSHCKWVNIHSPKGFLSFFEDFGIPETEKDAVLKSADPEIINKVIETASKYDMIITV